MKQTSKERFSRRIGSKALAVRWRQRLFLLPTLGWFYAEKDGHAVLKNERSPRKICGLFINTKIVVICLQWRRFTR
jgi:hypothetical protein